MKPKTPISRSSWGVSRSCRREGTLSSTQDKTRLSFPPRLQPRHSWSGLWAPPLSLWPAQTLGGPSRREGLQRVVTGRQFPARELGSKLPHHLLVVSLLAPPQLPLWFGFFVTKAVSVGRIKRKMANRSELRLAALVVRCSCCGLYSYGAGHPTRKSPLAQGREGAVASILGALECVCRDIEYLPAKWGTMGGAFAWTFAHHLAWPTWGRPQLAWSQQGLGCFQICFHFQFPLLLNHLRAAENKLLSSADLGFLASIVCSLLTLASDHFHPYPPPNGRHRPRIAAGKGGCRGCGQFPQ